MEKFEVVSVNYCTPDLIDRLITSIRKFSDVPIRIIDGSDKEPFKSQVKEVCAKFTNITLIQLGYNIHHGRGLDYAISSSTLDWCLCIDSDAEILNNLFNALQFTHFIEGFAYDVGFDKQYVHPEFMLVNVAKYKTSKYKFIHDGAPAFVINKTTDKLCMDHKYLKKLCRHGRGTCGRFGYNI